MCIRDRYWPIRLLKSLARLPIASDTWLGFGHTMDNKENFAENTKLCAAILTLSLIHISIDIFADGRTRNIPALYDGAIEITPILTVEELNAHVWGEEFHACIIEKAEFEAIWETHTYDGALK